MSRRDTHRRSQAAESSPGRPGARASALYVTAHDGAPAAGEGPSPAHSEEQALRVAGTPTSPVPCFTWPELHGRYGAGSGDPGRGPRRCASSQCQGRQVPLFWAPRGASWRGAQAGAGGADTLPGSPCAPCLLAQGLRALMGAGSSQLQKTHMSVQDSKSRRGSGLRWA